MNYKAVIEGILFIVGDEGISLQEISNILNIGIEDVKNSLIELKKDYDDEGRGLRISFLGNAFKLTTKEEHKEYYEKLVTDTKSNGLSNAALEVLAVIAYNEPITRIEIDEIRGVNSSQIVRRLLARGFIKICGKVVFYLIIIAVNNIKAIVGTYIKFIITHTCGIYNFIRKLCRI